MKSKVGDAENFGLSFHKNAQNPLRLTKSLIHPNSTKLLPSKQLTFFHDSIVAKKPADCSGPRRVLMTLKISHTNTIELHASRKLKIFAPHHQKIEKLRIEDGFCGKRGFRLAFGK